MRQNSLNLLRPRMRLMAEALMNSIEPPFKLKVYETLRSAEDQNAYFRKGLSRLDGYVKKSLHQEGLAVDFQLFKHGRLTWKKSDWERITPIANSLGLEHGLSWRSFPDFPHFQPNKYNLAAIRRESNG